MTPINVSSEPGIQAQVAAAFDARRDGHGSEGRDGWSRQTMSAQQEARALVTPRRAWQFSVVPLARRGETLEFATSAPQRERAERFVAQVLCLVPRAHVLEEPTLAACLHALYPFGGVAEGDRFRAPGGTGMATG